MHTFKKKVLLKKCLFYVQANCIMLKNDQIHMEDGL